MTRHASARMYVGIALSLTGATACATEEPAKRQSASACGDFTNLGITVSDLPDLSSRCSFSSDGVMSVTLLGDDTAILSVSEKGDMLINNVSCAGAKKSQLTKVVVTELGSRAGDQVLGLDFCTGTFGVDGPVAGIELDLGGSDNDVLLVTGTDDDDNVFVGLNGIGWTKSDAIDISWNRDHIKSVKLSLGEGNDNVNGWGSDALGAPFDQSMGIVGGNGNDIFKPGLGSDNLWGEAGDDTFVADEEYDGNDMFVGGEGTDLADYSARIVGVQIDVRAQFDDSNNPIGYEDGSIELGENDWIGRDREDVESLWGGSANDILIGAAAGSTASIKGNGGDDWLEAGLGRHFFEGGPGQDTVSYRDRSANISVNLETGAQLANDGEDGEGDQVNNDIEIMIGGLGDDFLEGNDSANGLIGGEGDDTLVGHGGNDVCHGGNGSDLFIADATMDGADVYDGGASDDAIYYGQRTLPLTITLNNDLADDGEANERDKLLRIENAWGGAGNDRLIGNDLNNVLQGGLGDDIIDAGGGDDTVMGDAGNDTLQCGAGSDVCYDPQGERFCPKSCEI